MGSATHAREAAAVAGAVLIAVAFAFTNKTVLFPGWIAWLPTAGTALMIGAGEHTRLNRIVALKAVVAVGKLSYPLYMWHWPVLIFGRFLTRDYFSGEMGDASSHANHTVIEDESGLSHARFVIEWPGADNATMDSIPIPYARMQPDTADPCHWKFTLDRATIRGMSAGEGGGMSAGEGGGTASTIVSLLIDFMLITLSSALAYTTLYAVENPIRHSKQPWVVKRLCWGLVALFCAAVAVAAFAPVTCAGFLCSDSG